MSNNLKKGIVAVFSANIINLFFNLLTNFLLPKYLSVESYAAIKTFQLYTTYIGIFSLGYSDGMYLRYGGKLISDINLRELKIGLFSFRTMMIAQSAIVIPITLIHGDRVLICFAATILSMNMTSYFKNLFQAVGEFSQYGKVLNYTTVATFLANMSLLFLIKTDIYSLYLLSYILVDSIIWIVLELYANKLMKGIGLVSFSVKVLIENIQSGFLLMIGNFSNILLSSVDRWFVKLMMDTTQFAYYSFAVSLEGFINIAVTPITTTLYNYFCTHNDAESVIKSRKYVTLFGTFIIAAAFPAKFIIEYFLKSYMGANIVIIILFSTQLVYLIIKGVYVNLYKAFKKQKLYFIRLTLILLIGVVLNYCFVKIYPIKESFAVGTLVSAVIWLILSIYDFQQFKYTFNEGVYVMAVIAIFILAGVLFNSLMGLVIYAISVVLLSFLFMRQETTEMLRMGRGILEEFK